MRFRGAHISIALVTMRIPVPRGETALAHRGDRARVAQTPESQSAWRWARTHQAHLRNGVVRIGRWRNPDGSETVYARFVNAQSDTALCIPR